MDRQIKYTTYVHTPIVLKYGENLSKDDIVKLINDTSCIYFITKLKNLDNSFKSHIVDHNSNPLNCIPNKYLDGYSNGYYIYYKNLELLITNPHNYEHVKKDPNNIVYIISAGINDYILVQQGFIYASFLGCNVKIIQDVGVDDVDNITKLKTPGSKMNIVIAGMEALLFEVVPIINPDVPTLCVGSNIGYGYNYQNAPINAVLDSKRNIGLFNNENIWGSCKYAANYCNMLNSDKRIIARFTDLETKLDDIIINNRQFDLSSYSGIIAVGCPKLIMLIASYARKYNIPVVAVPSSTSPPSFVSTIINNCIGNIVYANNENVARFLLKDLDV